MWLKVSGSGSGSGSCGWIGEPGGLERASE